MNDRHLYGTDLLIRPSGSAPPLSVRQELEADIVRLEYAMARKREMFELLDRNQDLERFIDLSRGR